MIEYITQRIAQEVLMDKKIEGKFICMENQFFYAIISRGGHTWVQRFDKKEQAEYWLKAHDEL